LKLGLRGFHQIQILVALKNVWEPQLGKVINYPRSVST